VFNVDIITGFLSALAGTGVGGVIVYLAFQKAVEKIVDEKLKPLKDELALIWIKHDKVKEDVKKEYVLKEVHEQAICFLDRRLSEGFDNLEKYLVRLEDKFDRRKD